MQREPVVVYIGIGANLGDATSTVRQALVDVVNLPGIQHWVASSLYSSAPVDAVGPDFINAVIGISTTLSAPDLLVNLHALEQKAGRQRPHRNAPRTLDLDLLLYGTASIGSKLLTVPHPRMWERAFVVLPLQEIAPQLVAQEVLTCVQCQSISRIA
jgi:2-amino-4-hydroxy-6-hydroxymethyldihydropteridine diphosphokinase